MTSQTTPPQPTQPADAAAPALLSAARVLASERATAGILASGAPDSPDLGRGAPGDADRVLEFARAAALAMPPGMDLAETWRWLAALGRHDLVVARLAEGHADAVTILAQAGRTPVPGAFYGVWASASGGTGLTAEPDAGSWRLCGTMRFCTGASSLDRALVTARTADGKYLLFDAGVRGDGWHPVEGTWPAVGMDLSQSLDIDVNAVVPDSGLVGGDGFYLQRPGFALGGIGVAAVWLGGAAGVLDTVAAGLRRTPGAHQLAHLGAMATAVLAADDVLAGAARAVSGAAADSQPESPVGQGFAEQSLASLALRARSTVEEAVRVVLDRAPRLTGPGPLCRDAQFAHRFSDLLVYVRQHHAERDLEALGTAVLASGIFGSRA